MAQVVKMQSSGHKKVAGKACVCKKSAVDEIAHHIIL